MVLTILLDVGLLSSHLQQSGYRLSKTLLSATHSHIPAHTPACSDAPFYFPGLTLTAHVLCGSLFDRSVLGTPASPPS